MASPIPKIDRQKALQAFSTGESAKDIAHRLGGGVNTLKRMWVEEFGEEVVRERGKKPGASEGIQKLALEAFPTEEPFKRVAFRLGMSPNTLRVLWQDRFGVQAFKERGEKVQRKGASDFGSRTKGKTKSKNYVTELCVNCSSEVRLTKGQLGKFKEVLCPTCRGKDTKCPVCGLLCGGQKGLSGHLLRWAKDAEHRAYVQKLEEGQWEGQVEGRDYVECRVCGFRGKTLVGHFRIHGLTSEDYTCRYPEARILSEVLYEDRCSKIQPFSYNFTSEDLLKHADENGAVVVESVCQEYGCRGGAVLSHCRKHSLPTRNRLAWQRVVLEQAKEYVGEDFVWEWSHGDIVNPESGRKLCFDGCFPQNRLIIEVHGEQHFRYSEKWHGTVEAFEAQMARDSLKREKAESLGYTVKVVRHSDPVFSRAFWEALLNGDPSQWDNVSEGEKERRVEGVLVQLRRGGWPGVVPSKQVKAELTQLHRLSVFLDDSCSIRPYSCRGASACGSFFPSRYRARHKGALSVYEAWHSDDALRKAIRLQLDSGHPTTPQRVLKALVMYHRAPSVFRPAVAKYVYQTYAPGGVVWDPCMGYGGRLMGAMSANVARYIATDVEPETVAGNRELAEALGVGNRCSLFECPAESFDPEADLDLVFTSPPYYDLEVYGKEGNLYGTVKEWLDKFLGALMKTAHSHLKPGGHLALNLPQKPVRGARLDLEARVIGRSLGLVEEPSLWMPVRTFKGPFKAEPILVWMK